VKEVSAAATRNEYGVVLAPGASEVECVIDRAETEQLHAARKGPLPMIDRGPGYERMVRAKQSPAVAPRTQN